MVFTMLISMVRCFFPTWLYLCRPNAGPTHYRGSIFYQLFNIINSQHQFKLISLFFLEEYNILISHIFKYVSPDTVRLFGSLTLYSIKTGNTNCWLVFSRCIAFTHSPKKLLNITWEEGDGWAYIFSGITLTMIHQIFWLARDWSKHTRWPNIPQLGLGDIQAISPNFKPYFRYGDEEAREGFVVVTEEGRFFFCLLSRTWHSTLHTGSCS